MGPHGGMPGRMEHLTKMLDLTAAQQEQVKAVFDGSQGQRKAIIDEPLSRADRRAKLKALMDDTRAKIRAVLTPEQQQKFDAMRQMRHERWGNHGAKPAGQPAAPAGTP